MSLVYLVVDFYPRVKSIRAILTTPAFLLQWLVFGFLDLLAFGILYHTSFQHVSAGMGAPHLAVAALWLLSTIGMYSILQSFTLNIAGNKVVDLERLVSVFRAEALEACVAREALLGREADGRIAAGLREVYRIDFQALAEDYNQVMSLAGAGGDQVKAQLKEYADAHDELDRDLILAKLVLRMPRTDRETAQRLLFKRRASQRYR